MSFTRYLEFDSSYRDRKQYPSPADFVVSFGQSGQKDKNGALDPVSEAAPLLFWNSSFDETTAALTVAVTGIDFTFTTSDRTTFVITAAANDLRNVVNYYAGAVLTLADGTTTIYTRIVTYKLLTTTEALVTVNDSLPGNFPAGAVTGNIDNPSNNTSTALVPLLFIPAGSNGDNFYINYSIQNLATQEIIAIAAYDGTTHLATLESNSTVSWASSNANFILRKVKPISNNTIVAIDTVRPTAIQLATTENPNSGSLNGSFIRMVTPVPTNAGFSTNVAPYGEQVGISNYIAGSGTISAAIAAGTNTFTLSTMTSSSDNSVYVNGILTIGAENKRITTYNGTTRSGTVSSNWAAPHAAGDTWTMNTAVLAGTFTTNPAAGDSYELEAFTRDNVTPLNYLGSIVSSSQEVCYEVELINLILPNTLLACGKGGRAIFYPYLYVRLEQISGGRPQSIIVSNNPNSTTMMFRAVVDDTTLPATSPFIKIDSDSMTHTIKFKPTDSFRFTVTLPNGELFRTVNTEYFSPSEPNALVQISACFSFKRSS